jgi:hypothetical protein
MYALVSLLVCLSAQPHVCETVLPSMAHAEDGAPPTFFECMGVAGQDIARRWLAEHPQYELRRISCSIANDPVRLRDQVATPEA